MKSTKLKKVLVYTTLAASMTAITAIAATNPADTTSNPATSAGQSAINSQNAGTLATPANTDSGLTTTNAPEGVENESIQEAVATCPLQEASTKAMKDAMEVIQITPDVDGLFNNSTEAAKGCFAASSKVMNLALEIPSFDGFNSAASQIIKQNLTKMIEQKQQEFLAMGCEIADQALLSALSPVQDYLASYQLKVGAFNGLLGNLDMGAGYEGNSTGGFYDGISDSIGSTIDDAKSRIETDGKNLQAVSDNLENQYKNILNGSVPISNGSSSSATTTVTPTTSTPAAAAFTAAPTTSTVQPTTSSSVSTPAAASTTTSSANPYGSPTTQSATNPF